MVSWSLAMKDLLLLWRDRRALIILGIMPLVFIAVLGLSLGEGFGQKPDERLRVSVVDQDLGRPTPPGARPEPFPGTTWSKVIEDDLQQTAGVRLEIIPSLEEAKELVSSGKRSAVIVLGPEFSKRMHDCSFLAQGINPFHRDGVELSRVDAQIIRDPTQLVAASIIEQVAQVTTMRVLIPWMIGRAFEALGTRLGRVVATAVKQQFPNYDFNAKTWSGLCKEPPKPDQGLRPTIYAITDEGGMLHRGSQRYQILVPSYTVMFSFFLVLTCGWLFAAERRQGTLKRLKAAPISRASILLGKLLPCLVLSVTQGLFLLTAGRVVFGMSWGPHPEWMLVVVFCTAFAATGLSLLVAALARTETQVMIHGTMVVLVMAGISGCLMPRELMPEQMKTLSRITPHAWALDAYGQLLLNPQPNAAVVGMACAALASFGLGFFLFALLFLDLD